MADLTGWWIGYGIGAVVVVAVAMLVIGIIATVRSITEVAEAITDGLAVTRDRTEALWTVGQTMHSCGDLLETAVDAREALEAGR